MYHEIPKARTAEELRQAARDLHQKREMVLGVVVRQGFTLNSTKDPVKRLQRLHEVRLNLSMKILESLDQLGCINHEIQELEHP